jgi:hypothetical protein
VRQADLLEHRLALCRGGERGRAEGEGREDGVP